MLRLVGGYAPHKPNWLTTGLEEDRKKARRTTLAAEGLHIAFFVKSDDIVAIGGERSGPGPWSSRMYTVRFWGVRGSIACPGPDTVRYGGNTSCVEIRCGDRLMVFDGGTGLRLLGNELMRGRQAGRAGPVLQPHPFRPYLRVAVFCAVLRRAQPDPDLGRASRTGAASKPCSTA